MRMVEGTAGTGLYERAEHASRVIRARTKLEPRIAIVLGSGLGSFADDFDDAVAIPYEEIPGFMRSTAQGHAGRAAFITTKATRSKKSRFRFALSTCSA